MAFGLSKLTDFLNKGERFSEIAESKGPLDAVGIVTQLPIGSLRLKALGFITRVRGGTPPRQGVQVFSASVSVISLSSNHLSRQWRAYVHRSISPNTMSSEPMIADTSASMCPRVKKSIAER